MKKQDLTEEYTVVYRNGEFREFSNGEFFDGRRKVNNITNYSDDLRHFASDKFDIMSVKRDGITIWTREEITIESKQQAESKDNEESGTCNLHSKYQRFFEFMNQEHDLMLMVEQMDEIIHEVRLFLNENDQDDIYTEPKTINTISLLMMLPESVQLEIVRAMSEEQKLKLIGL